MDVEQRVRAAVAQLGLDHEMLPCDPDLADTAAFCEHYGYELDRSANTIVVASKRPPGHYAACVVLANTRLDVNKTVRNLMSVRKLSFAPADVTADVTGMVMGGVTPFALPEDVPIYVDAAVMERDWVILGGGSRSLKIKISPEALLAVGGEAITGLANPIPEA
jgi:prolyl-tRNA editing enzyme YbaK/EbsC (Cys-tRNA(Pro) deacylase)